MIYLLFFLGVAASLEAQPQAAFIPAPGETVITETTPRPPLAPLPPWPANGVPQIAPNPKGPYLFWETATGDYIAHFPESLLQPQSASKAFRTVRIRMPNKARATATVRISRTSNDEFVYHYSVTTRRESSRPLHLFRLKVAEDDEFLTMRHPTWNTSGESLTVLAAKPGSRLDPEAVKHIPKLRWPDGRRPISWSTYKTELMMQPGTTGDGFALRSRYRPGLTLAIFHGGEGVAIEDQIPEVVDWQLRNYLTLENEGYQEIAIGPIFAPDRTVLWLAANWHAGLQQLAKARKIDPQSPFLAEALKHLVGIMQSQDHTMLNGTRSRAPGFQFRTHPANAFEQQLLAALVACFQ